MSGSGYRQPVKARSRELLWSNAVAALTGNRDSARLLRSDMFRDAWQLSTDTLDKIGLRLNDEALLNWIAFSENRYGSRHAGELRVAYLCGPEPENDLRVLTSLGVRIENVWAVEADNSADLQALAAARTTYPALKIYHGTFDSFVRVVRDRFDIVYLDFTAPLFSPQSRPYATLHTVFDQQILADLAMLIINVGEPENSTENCEFLADYFQQQPYIESTALGYGDKDDPDAIWYAEIAPDEWGSRSALISTIGERFKDFYSAFCTQYPALYANRVQPALRILRVADARNSLFAKETQVYDHAVRSATGVDAWTELLSDGKVAANKKGFGPGMDVQFTPGDYPIWWFIENLGKTSTAGSKTARKWLLEFQNNLPSIDGSSYKPSRVDAAHLSDLLWSIVEGYYGLAAERLLASTVGALRQFAGRKQGLFCDEPMLHLLTELAVNQLGYPHHPVLDRHWRATYIAKSTPMYLDAHLFDQCRPLYDSLPAIPLYPEHFANLQSQMITRIGISIIEGRTHGIVPRLYRGSALAGRYGDDPWSRFATPVVRRDLNTWPFPSEW